MSKRINLFLDDKEFQIVADLKGKYGGTYSEIVKSAIKFKYDKSFPPHTIQISKPRAIKAKEEEMTKEQICEQMGGKIVDQGGKRVCVMSSINRVTGKEYVSNTLPLEMVNKKMLEE